jgi:hypothetical protein
MTINLANNNPRIEYSVAQGVTQTSFAVPFEFFNDTDLTVYVDAVVKTQGTHYTVSGGDGSTGTITMSVTGITGGSEVVITRNIPLERVTDFSAGADINRAALNEQLDTLTAMLADLKAKIERAPALPEYDTIGYSFTLPDSATRASKYLAFGVNGELVASNGTSSTIVASAYGETLIAQNTAAAALTTLGLTATAAELNHTDGVTSAIQTQLNNKQPLDAELTAIAAISSNGVIARTGAGTASARTITGTSNQITVTDGDGAAGNPTIAAVVASQAEAEAGSDTTKLMTPQRVLQSITANSTVLLSTLTTVTGNTYTTPTLDLTPYKFITAVVEGLGDNSTTSGTLNIFGLGLVATGTTAASRIYGSWTLELRTGLFFGASNVIAPSTLPQLFTLPVTSGGRTALNHATTTFTVTMTTTNFAAGNVTFYGIR